MSPEDTSLKYRYEMKYRTATIMEEDALNQPTAAGEISSLHMLTSPNFNEFQLYSNLLYFIFSCRSVITHTQ